MKILLIVLVFVSCTCLVYGQEDSDCDNLGGICMSIADCPVLKPYIHSSGSKRGLIMDYHCGFNGNVPKVCCQPDDCTFSDLMSKTCSVDYTTENNLETGVNILLFYK